MRWWRGLWTLAKPSLWVLGMLMAAVLCIAATLNWVLRHEAGTAWLLRHLPGVQADGLEGALLADRWKLRRLHVRVGGSVRAVVIDDLDAQGVRWRWDTAAPRWLTLQVTRLSARQVTLETGTSESAARVPSSLQLPLAVDVGHLSVARVQIGSQPALLGLQAKIALETESTDHRVDELQFERDRLRVRGNARIHSLKPFKLQARALLRPLQGDEWSADLIADGVLERLAVQATLRADAGTRNDAPSFDATAAITPFAPWPLASLSARTQALDLATLSSALPQTRLSGTAELRSSALDAPFSADVRLDNAAAGRWDEQRLPVRRLELALKAVLKQRDTLEFTSFDVSLGGSSGAAGASGGDGGRWKGSGRWTGERLVLDSQVMELRPHLLDSRAPRMTASGPLLVALQGLSIPGTSVTTTAAAAAASAASAAAPSATPAALSLELKSTLDGRIDGATQPVKLQFDALLSSQQLELRQLRATAGSALAQAQLTAKRQATGQWAIQSAGSLSEFDPRLWWPGAEGSAWRQSTHRLQGDWRLDLTANPPRAASAATATVARRSGKAPDTIGDQTPLGLAWLPRLAGTGALRLRDSVFAGVPMDLDMTLSQATAEGSNRPAHLKLDLQLAGNQLTLEAHGNPAGDGDNDLWQAELKGGQLAALAPLARLSEDLAPWAPRGGSVDISLQMEGRWPTLRSSGQARLERVVLGELSLQQADARWRLDTGRDKPWDAQLELRGLQQGRQGIDRARMALQGTVRDHQLQLDATLPLRPPGWLEELLGTQTSGAVVTGTRTRLSAEGQWLGDGAGGGEWRGRIASMRAQNWDPRREATDNAATWLEASDLRAALRFSAEGGLVEWRASPARIRLADTLTLRWDEVRVDMRPNTPGFELRAEIEPFAAAPVLARLQPAVGWGGDLQLAATLDVKTSTRFDADVVFERRGGDLFVEDALGRQPLGLTAMRLAASAHDGVWRFVPQIAGRTLGEVSGSVQARTDPAHRWPDARAPLEGAIEARVTNIGIWGTWVPPGWRLVGAMSTSAAVGGTFGAPQYTGSLQGSNIGVRNLLLGVDVSGGDVLVSLKGDRAQIERFSLRGGDGLLTLSGGAEFGSQPVARVKLHAERFRVLGRVDRLLRASGDANLEFRSDRLKLDGQVRVDEGLFDVSRRDAPSLDEDVTIRGADPGASAAAASTVASTATAETGNTEVIRPLRRNSQVSLSVDLGDKLRVRGRGLDTLLNGQLRFSTPEGRPHLSGIVRASEGTYVGYGQKLEIDRGMLSFSGPPENPSLDILALRQNLDVRVGVAVIGSLVNPRVRLYSDPEMSETDKLSWLVLGRPGDGLGRADTALLQRAAVALLSGEGEAPTDAFLRSIGLDELSLRQGDGEVRDTVITLGKQLSRRWYVGYERGVNATSGTWQLIYRIAQRFTLRAQTGHENSLDVIWVWRRGEAVPAPSTKP